MNLLSKAEKRRLDFLEILSYADHEITYTELSRLLNASVRVLKEDVLYFRKNFTSFSILQSEHAVEIRYKQNEGIKSVFQFFLEHSSAYQVLEGAFIYEGKSIDELEELLYISRSTIYRLIKKINLSTSKYDFKIQTNPIAIIGNEKNIRKFFYTYFYEKCSFKALPFFVKEEKTLDKFLKFHLQLTQLKDDFAYFEKFKTITAVNLARFQKNHHVETDHIELNFASAIPDLTPYADLFEEFEVVFQISYDDFAIKQIFTHYVDKEFSLTYEHLMHRAKQDEDIASEITKIREVLERVSKENNIPIPNIEKTISAFRNIIHLDYLEPDPGYILYNRDQCFIDELEENYPDFYRSLSSAIQELRAFYEKPPTQEGTNFYVYTVFTYWKGLVAELRRKTPKIRVMVISDRHFTHARMIKEFIDFEFSEQSDVEIYSSMELNYQILEELEHELIVTNFLIPEIEGKKTVYIKNLPTPRDLAELQNKMDKIIEERQERKVVSR